LHLALQRQPNLAVQRASLAAAEDAARALEAMHVPTCLVPELPIRRQQTALGVQAAAAALAQVERDTIYAVTRTYFTVVYARAQERVAKDVVERVKDTHDLAERMLKAGARDVADTDVDRSAVYLDLARVKQVQAAKGIERALAALHEAIGLSPCLKLHVATDELPEPNVHPCRGEVVAWAVMRRGEVIEAHIFTDLVGLEVEAQGTSNHHQFHTFAQGGDIHARPVPPEIHNSEYRPGAVPPEMPVSLAGTQAERMMHAHDLQCRAAAVDDKARGLVALEAEDAYLRWEEASEKAAFARRAAERGQKLGARLTKDLAGGQRVKVEDVVNAHVLAAQARSQFYEYLYDEILALADLERITGGAFCAGLAVPPPAPEPLGQPKKAPEAGPDVK
jgi:hypothetical protein